MIFETESFFLYVSGDIMSLTLVGGKFKFVAFSSMIAILHQVKYYSHDFYFNSISSLSFKSMDVEFRVEKRQHP